MAEQTITEPRDFPSIDELLQHPSLATVVAVVPRPIATQVVREVVAELKEKLQTTGKGIPFSRLLSGIEDALGLEKRRELTRVINATGIIVHTNLGRAPLPEKILRAILPTITGYSSVEFDLKSGRRGDRGQACESYLATLAGAEAGTIVNNCAAALFVILNTLGNKKNVIISRGELVQIGGGFRIPDILRRAGARLSEVGTTNITTIQDYESAIDDSSALILKVHKSNFVQAGFTEEVPLADLVALGKKRNVPVVNDLGSGVFVDTGELLGYRESTVQQSVRAGAGLTCFSGDKLLGGMQAGMIVGSADLVKAVKKNPLFRTVRVDKMVLAFMEQVLGIYLSGSYREEIPVWHMLSVPASDLYRVGKQILKEIGVPSGVSVEATKAFVGGGALPESDIPSVAVVFAPELDAARLMTRFRRLQTPIIGRIENDRFFLDLKAIAATDYPYLLESIKQILTPTQ
jgi:L-seryl-tRNA(Ser) seleniumtransferase